jgi:hypothetical protein
MLLGHEIHQKVPMQRAIACSAGAVNLHEITILSQLLGALQLSISEKEYLMGNKRHND